MLHKQIKCKKRISHIYSDNSLTPFGRTLAAIFSIMLVLALVPTAAFAEAGKAVGGDELEAVETAALVDGNELEAETTLEDPGIDAQVDADEPDSAETAVQADDGQLEAVNGDEQEAVNGQELVSDEDNDATTGTNDWATFGGCKWQIDDEGTLTIKPGESTQQYAAGQLPNGCIYSSHWPWHNSRSSIKKVEFLEGVKAGNSLKYIFAHCENLTSINLSQLDTSKANAMNGMFNNCQKLPSLDLSSFDTSNVTGMSSMFESCYKLTSIDLSSFDTSKVTTMNSMFWGCWELASLDLSGFNTSCVTDMNSMFYNCNSLTSLGLSSFDTSKVTSMSSMFSSCESVVDLDISSFDTSKVNLMSWMFLNCSSLTSIDLSSFDTSNVNTMYEMFGDCPCLTTLDLSGFDTSKVTRMGFMFKDDSALETVFVSDRWVTTQVVDDTKMFLRCTSIKGGAGTVFDENHIDKTYARIDRGPTSEAPGYLTDKYIVTFIGNGATSGSMSPQNFTPGQSQALTKNTFERTGYEFLGWSEDSSATTANYPDKAEITINKSITLYAVWKAIKSIPTANDFTFTAPLNLTYDGTAKSATVEAKQGVTGMGAVSVKYFAAGGTQLSSAPINAGDYTVKIDVAEGSAYVSAENLTDASWKFTIAPASLPSDAIQAIADQMYTGSAIEPSLVVKVGDKELTKDADYTAAFENNTEIGTATVTVTGIGNYTASASANFNIVVPYVIDEKTGVKIAGMDLAGKNVKLEVAVLSAGSEGYDKAKSELMTDNYDSLVVYDIKLFDKDASTYIENTPQGLTVTMPVDAAYEGRTVKLVKWHGTVESHTSKDFNSSVVGGTVVVSGITELSQFNLLMQNQVSPSPESGSEVASQTTSTRDIPWPAALISLLCVSAAVALFALRKKTSFAC